MTRPRLSSRQATILPVNVPGAACVSQSGSPYGAADASTTGSGEVMPRVMDEPVSFRLAPPARSVTVDWKARCCVDAATVVTHGPLWLAVPAVGPSLPAEAETNTPAAYASRKASSTGSL